MQWLWDEFSVSVSKPTLSRELHALGYRKLPTFAILNQPARALAPPASQPLWNLV